MTAPNFYGLQPVAPAAPPTASTGAGTVPGTPTTAEAHNPIGTASTTSSSTWHQRPVLVIVLIIAGAWVLARLAEHGAGFGIWGKA